MSFVSVMFNFVAYEAALPEIASPFVVTSEPLPSVTVYAASAALMYVCPADDGGTESTQLESTRQSPLAAVFHVASAQTSAVTKTAIDVTRIPL